MDVVNSTPLMANLMISLLVKIYASKIWRKKDIYDKPGF